MKRTTATGAAAGFHADRVPGVSAGTLGIAEDRNNLQEEIISTIDGLGVALDGTDWLQLEKAIIARSHVVGEIIDIPIELTAVGWASARSKVSPTNPQYMPVLLITDADHDVTAASAPLFVTAMRAQKAKSGATTDHSVTVAAHVVTGSGTPWDNMLAALAEDLLIHGSYTAWRCLNVGGVDYAITNVNPGAHTITITGDALSGSQTAIWYPYRIAGLATSARVFKDSGRALVSADGTVNIGGARRRDYMQGHFHTLPAAGGGGVINIITFTTVASAQSNFSGSPVTDGVNGTPRTGLTTDPRAMVVFRYLWLGVYLA